MFTDYKFWYIRRDDDGFITEAAVRFYEGHYVSGEYVRTKRLPVAELTHLAKKVKDKLGIQFLNETNQNEVVVYTQEDFGQIKTDDELRTFLNKEISKDKIRTVIPEQQWQP